MARRQTKPEHCRRRGRVPHFWWDIHWENDKMVAIHIETDDERVPNGLADIVLLPETGPFDLQMDRATQIVNDFKSGRRLVR